MHLFHYVGHVIGSFILFLKLILGKIYPFFVFEEVGPKHSIDFFEVLQYMKSRLFAFSC